MNKTAMFWSWLKTDCIDFLVFICLKKIFMHLDILQAYSDLAWKYSIAHK